MKKLKVLILVSIIFCSIVSNGQNDQVKIDKNIIKLNLWSLPLKNHSFQIERVLTKRISAGIGVGFKPEGSIPFKNQIINWAGDDLSSTEEIENFKYGSLSITPEMRFFLSKKGYGRGFYIAPYYRYTKYSVSDLPLTFEDDAGIEQDAVLKGSFSSNNGGVLLGVQWFLGKRMTLDWWIVGAHIGKSEGGLDGKTSKTLNMADQNLLNEDLNDLLDEIPIINYTTSTSSNGIKIDIDGPWAGLRAGLSIGIKF